MKKLSFSFTFILLCLTLSAQWVQIPGPFGGAVQSITGYGLKVFAGTPDAGVFHSPVQGLFWNKANTGLHVNCLVLSMCVMNGKIYAGTDQGLYTSIDDGLSWQYSPSLGNTYIRLVKPIDSTIYASTYNSGLYKSVNNGVTWTLISAGIPPANYITSMVKHGNDFIAVTITGLIFKSINNDNSWNLSNTGITATSISSIISDGSLLFAGTSNGIFASDDNGDSWMTLGLQSTYIYSLSLMNNYLFAGLPNSVFRYDVSFGISGSWVGVNNGLPNQIVRALYNDGNRIYAGTSAEGFFASSDNGNTWSETNTGLTNSNVSKLHYDGTTLFAATLKGLFYSQNYGSTWFKHNLGNVNPGSCPSISESATHLMASINSFSYHGVGFSDDGGNTWNMSTNGLPSNGIYELLPVGSTTFITSANGAASVYRTTNNGISWTLTNNGITNLFINEMATDGVNVFGTSSTTGSGGLYLTSNLGQSWTKIGISVLPSNLNFVKVYNDTVLVGSQTGEIYISTNSGSQWTQAGSGIPSNASITEIYVEHDIIIAGTTKGVYISNNFGLSWYNFNVGLTTTNITSIIKIGSTIYVGTNGGSIYSHASLLTEIKNIEETRFLFSIYPNPVSTDNMEITIKSNHQQNNVTFDVLNISGQIVYSKNISIKETKVTLPSLKKGFYNIRITDSKNTLTQKLVVN